MTDISMAGATDEPLVELTQAPPPPSTVVPFPAPPKPPASAPINEFDVVAAPQAMDGPINEFDIEGIKKQETGIRGRASVISAQGSNPDAAAKALALSKKTGVPASAIEADPSRAQRRVALNEFDVAPEGVQQWVAQDPINARLANDDYESLGMLERRWVDLKTALFQKQSATGAFTALKVTEHVQILEDAKAKRARGEIVPPFQQRMLDQEDALRAASVRELTGALGQYMEKGQAAADLPRNKAMAEMQEAAKTDDWASGMWQAFRKDPLGIIATLSTQSAVDLPGQIGAGIVAGPTGAGVYSFMQEYVSGVLDVLEEKKIDIKDPTALLAAFSNPTLMEEVRAQSAKKAAVVGAFDALSFGLASKSMGFGLKGAKARFAANIPAQIITQGALGGAGEALGSVAADRKIDPFNVFAEIAGEAGMAPMEVGGARTWRNLHSQDVKAGEWEKFKALPPAEQTATLEAMGLDKMIADAQSSKLATRSPEKLEEFLSTVTGPDASVFVPAETVAKYFQSKRVEDMQALSDALGITDQLPEALARGGDVVIPMSRYVTESVKSDIHAAWREDVRLQADGFSIRQAQEDAKVRDARVKEAVARFEKQLEAGIAEVDATTRVYEDLRDKLKTAGNYTSEAAGQQAAVLAARYATRAARDPGSFIDAWDAYSKAGRGTGVDIRSQLSDRVVAYPPDDLDVLLNSIKSGKVAPTKTAANAPRPIPGWEGRVTFLGYNKDNQPLWKNNATGDVFFNTPSGGLRAWSPNLIEERNTTGTLSKIAETPEQWRVHHGAPKTEVNEQFLKDREELATELEKIGVDPRKMTNAQVRAAIKTEVEKRKTGGKTFEQPVYHGSPHIFDKFSLDKIGTGEGAQAFGWGLYFAGKKAVAAGYRRMLSREKARFLVDGKEVNGPLEAQETIRSAVVADARNSGAPVSFFSGVLTDFMIAVENGQAIDRAKYAKSDWAALANRIADEVDARVKVERPGRLYHVEIPDDGAYLNWDKPLSEQSPEVKAALEKMGVKPPTPPVPPRNPVLASILRRALKQNDGDPRDIGLIVNNDGALYKLASAEAGAKRLEQLDLSPGEWVEKQAKEYLDALTAGREFTGEKIYKALSERLAAAPPDEMENPGGPRGWGMVVNTRDGKMANDKAASLALREAGIPGIQYLDASSRSDGEGSHNYVLFDDALAEIKTYEQEARGQITFADNLSTITLFQGRDLSTLLHEVGHLWLEELGFDAKSQNAPAQIKADYQTVLDWLGSKDGYITTEMHEQFARGIETYFMEGKAPSTELRSAFQSFKRWLIQIYKRLTALNSPITPEIRAVFDRLIATDEQIEQAQTKQGLNPIFKTAKDMDATKAVFDAYTKRANAVVDEAEQKLLQKTMEAIRKARTKEWKFDEKLVREDVTNEVMSESGMQALMLLTKGEFPALERVATAAEKKAADDEVIAAQQRLDARKEYGPDVRKPYEDAIKQAQEHRAALERPRVSTPETLKGIKLTKEDIVELYGDESVLAMLPAGIYRDRSSGPGAMSPDELAPFLGIDSGKDLIERLMQIEATRREMVQKGDKRSVATARIAEETAQRMNERYGDPLNDGTIEQEAMAAIHSDKQAALMSYELGILARKLGHTGTITWDDIKNWAATAIGDKSVRDGTRAQQYLRAERQAGRKIEQALIKGDDLAAFKARQDQMVNHALFMEATKAAEEVDSARKLMTRYASAATLKNMDQDYLDQIHTLLEGFEFQTRSGVLLAERKAYETFVAEQKEAGVTIVPLIKGFGLTNYQDMKIDELRGLVDTIKQIAALGRDVKKVEIDGQKRELDAVLTEVETTAAKGPQRGTSQSVRGKSDIEISLGGAQHFARIGNALLMKVERLMEFADGDKTGRGIFTRAVYRPMAKADGDKNDRLTQLGKEFKALYDIVPWEQRKRWHERHVTPEVGGKLRKEEIIVAALNMGNESNLDKLVRGNKWDEDATRAMVNKHLTKEEWQFVQASWDLLESYWPEYSAMLRDVEGVAPPKIEPLQVVTPFGTLRGGYFPVDYDRRESLAAQRVGEARDASLDIGMSTSQTFSIPTTRAGAANKRTGFAAPVTLDLSIMGKHLEEVIHDITHRRAVRDVYKVINNDRFREALRSRLGPEYEEHLLPWLRRVSSAAKRNNAELKAADSVMRWLRVNTTITAMGLRVSTGVQQISGYILSVQRLGTKYMLKGMAEYFVNIPKARDTVYEMSAFMRNRANNYERDTKAAVDKHKGKSAWKQGYVRWAFRGIALMDLAVSIPTWQGAYMKGLAEGLTEADAIYYADKMVRDTQGGGSTLDMAPVQDGTEAMKLGTMFYSFLNVYYNAQQGIIEDVRNATTFSEYADAFWQTALLMGFSTIVAALLAGQGPGDDEDPLYWGLRQIGFGAFSGIPLARDAANTLMREYGGQPTGGFKMSPAQGPIEGSMRLVRDLIKMSSGDEPSNNVIKNTFNVLGFVTGTPGGQPGVTAQFLYDSLVDGSENPENILEWMRGLTYGPKK